MERTTLAWLWLAFMLAALFVFLSFPLGLSWVDQDGIGFFIPRLGGYYWQL